MRTLNNTEWGGGGGAGVGVVVELQLLISREHHGNVLWFYFIKSFSFTITL